MEPYIISAISEIVVTMLKSEPNKAMIDNNKRAQEEVTKIIESCLPSKQVCDQKFNSIADLHFARKLYGCARLVDYSTVCKQHMSFEQKDAAEKLMNKNNCSYNYGSDSVCSLVHYKIEEQKKAAVRKSFE